MNAFGLAPLILIIPAAGFLLNALFGRRFVEADQKVGERWSGWFASVMALSTFTVALLLYASLATNHFEPVTAHLFNWIVIPASDFVVSWAIQIDTLSVTMMLVVAGVGSLIHIYAIGYMHGDPDFSRFFAYMNLFLFFMLVLVSANNYLMMFVGWEGVGLCSFLLIGFWFDRVDENKQPMNANAARKAFVANRIGDFGMILAMILLVLGFGSLTYNAVFENSLELFATGESIAIFGTEVSVGAFLTVVTALFLLGAAGKSAQIPLYVWLPDAMAGPTPVSALIHAATMVTAGIYLIVRSNVLYEIVRASEVYLVGSLSTNDLVALTGAVTALVAGLIAFTQFDIKKVLAYSTISQLGFMIAAAGMGAYVAAMFHLITHAFFKALLFLSAGSVIHGMEHGHQHLTGSDHDSHDDFDPQDMRTMGGLRHRMKTTFVVFMIGSLALAGIVPLAGFWSKDEILAHGAANKGTDFQIVYIMLLIAAFCTAFYVGRQLKMVFFGSPRDESAKHAAESPAIMTAPLIVLAIMTVVGGLFNTPFFTTGAATRAHEVGDTIQLELEEWLEHAIESIELSHEEVGELPLLDLPETPTTLNINVALLSLGLALFGLGLAIYVVYRRRPKSAEDPDPLERTPIWWFSVLPLNTLYMNYLIPAFNWLAHWLAEKLDWEYWHDFFHDRIVRDGYVGLSNFLNQRIDIVIIDDGLVNGSARATGWVAGQLRKMQTGYVRNYALGVLLGVIALLVYFIFIVS